MTQLKPCKWHFANQNKIRFDGHKAGFGVDQYASVWITPDTRAQVVRALQTELQSPSDANKFASMPIDDATGLIQVVGNWAIYATSDYPMQYTNEIYTASGRTYAAKPTNNSVVIPKELLDLHPDCRDDKELMAALAMQIRNGYWASWGPDGKRRPPHKPHEISNADVLAWQNMMTIIASSSGRFGKKSLWGSPSGHYTVHETDNNNRINVKYDGTEIDQAVSAYNALPQ